MEAALRAAWAAGRHPSVRWDKFEVWLRALPSSSTPAPTVSMTSQKLSAEPGQNLSSFGTRPGRFAVLTLRSCPAVSHTATTFGQER